LPGKNLIVKGINLIIKGGAMMKSFYIAAWFLLILAASVTILTGSVNRAMLVVLGLVTLGPIYALASWLIITNTREKKTE